MFGASEIKRDYHNAVVVETSINEKGRKFVQKYYLENFEIAKQYAKHAVENYSAVICCSAYAIGDIKTNAMYTK